MSRTRLTNITQDLVSDSGSILWSLVKGEQLEFPITLNFIDDASVKRSNNYTYEAVLVEADNAVGQSAPPSIVKTNGVRNTLFVRLPVFLGEWQSVAAYNKEEVVLFNQKYYKLVRGSGRVSAVSPDLDSAWTETVLNRIYLQFPSTIGQDWSVQPGVGYSCYAFFELRVTEPNDPIYVRTFKPVRGMVEILFSPTDIVADIAAQTT